MSSLAAGNAARPGPQAPSVGQGPPGWGTYTPPVTRARYQATGRIQSLDGLRAISILLVLIAHVSGTRLAPAWYGSVESAFGLDLAHLGVEVFFVISGFLITKLLLAEWHASGTLDLRRFYLRRFVRLMPSYAALTLVAAASSRAGILHLKASDLVHAATYSMNYANAPSWSLGHLWSLAVEEQFYFVWPCTFVLLGRDRAAIGALAAVVLLPLLRMEMLAHHPDLNYLFAFRFESCADILALGCLMALWSDADVRAPHMGTIRRFWWLIAPAMLLASVHLGRSHWRAQALLPNLLTGFAILIVLDWAIHLAPGSLAARALNNRPIVFVGQASYSLYLWQQLFLNRHEPHWWTSYPVNVLLAIAAAVTAYHLIEKPTLARRRQIERWVLGKST